MFGAFRVRIFRKSDFWCCGNGFLIVKGTNHGSVTLISVLRYGSLLLVMGISDRGVICISTVMIIGGRWFWILSWKLEGFEHFVWKSFFNPIFGVVEIGFLIVKGTNHISVTLILVQRNGSLLSVMGISDRGVICVSTVMIIGGVDFEFWVENLKV